MRRLPAAALLLLPLGPVQAALDDGQRAWIRQHPPVRFAPEADYGPFVFVDGAGTVQGLSIDVLRLIQRHTGLDVQMLAPAPLHHNLVAARERRVDLLSSLRPTPERAEYLEFSRPYVSVPALVIVAGAAPAPPGDGEVLARLAGRPVAVGKGYAVEAFVRQRHPAVDWRAVDDDAQALRGVAEGRYAAAVADSASVAFIVARDRLNGLTSAGRVDFEYTLSFAVRKDWPELRAIVDEGIRAIGVDERRELLELWSPELQAAAATPHAAWPTRVAIALLVLAGAIVVWHRLRQRRGRGGDSGLDP